MASEAALRKQQGRRLNLRANTTANDLETCKVLTRTTRTRYRRWHLRLARLSKRLRSISMGISVKILHIVLIMSRLVMDTLQPLPQERKCFRLINGSTLR